MAPFGLQQKMNTLFFRIWFCVLGCAGAQIASAQVIEIQGRIGYSAGGLFATGDTFTAVFNLAPTRIPSFGPGHFTLAAGDLQLSHGMASFVLPSFYANGFTSDNATMGTGNVTGIDFDFQSSSSAIRRFHGELYSLFPQNPQITDSYGMLLDGISVDSLITNPWNFIDTTTGTYSWMPISYNILSAPPTAVPESSAYGIFGVGLLALAVRSKRLGKEKALG